MFDWRSILRRLGLNSNSLRVRSGAMILAGAALPALLLGTAIAVAEYLAARDRLNAELTTTVRSGVRTVDLYIDEYLRALSIVAREWRDNPNVSEGERLARLAQLREGYDDFITLLATDATGQLIASAPRVSSDGRFDFWRRTRVEDREYFTRPRDTGEPFVSNLFKGRGFGSDYLLAVAVPVIRDGQFHGVIEGSLPSARFASHYAGASVSPGFEMVVTDARGKVVYASPGLKLVVGSDVHATRGLACILGMSDAHEGAGEDLSDRFISSHHPTEHGWRVAALAPRAMLTDSAFTAIGFAIGLVTLALFVAITLLPAATRALTEHIARVADRMRAFSLADGEMSAQMLDVPPELEPVHDAFSTLGRKLRHTFAQLHSVLENERALRAELERSRVEIEASERRLRLVLESVPEGVLMISAQGEVLLWNRAADPLLGIVADAAAAAEPRVSCLFNPDGTPHPPPETLLLRTFVEGAFDSHEVLQRCPGGGEDRRLLASARVLRDAQGAVRGAVGVFRDVTRERAAQEQLMISDRMASIGMLAAGVGHEINNPLAALMADIDAALADLDAGHEAQSRARESLIDARQAGARIREIARDLKYFARHDAEGVGECELNRMLESSARMASSHIRPRARLVVGLTAPLRVHGSESRLGQVFLNLLVNAAQAIKEGQADANTITLRSRDLGDGQVIVEVTDTGSGMSPETLRRLFTPLFTTKPQGEGTGLGLTICQGIVKEAGGVIDVESQLGKGTTFRVRLRKSATPSEMATKPAVDAKPLAIASTGPTPRAESTIDKRAAASVARVVELARSARHDMPVDDASAHGRRGRVLVVDDERLIASAIRRVLGRDHEVLDCTRAEDALNLIARDDGLDVILCDLMMPGMTGMDLHARLLREHPALAERMIFLTGGAFTAAARKFLAEVSCPHLEKPFDAEALRGLVNQRVA